AAARRMSARRPGPAARRHTPRSRRLRRSPPTGGGTHGGRSFVDPWCLVCPSFFSLYVRICASGRLVQPSGYSLPVLATIDDRRWTMVISSIVYRPSSEPKTTCADVYYPGACSNFRTTVGYAGALLLSATGVPTV